MAIFTGKLSYIQVLSIVTVALILGTFIGLNVAIFNLTGIQNEVVKLNKETVMLREEIITLKAEVATLEAEIVDLKEQLLASEEVIQEQRQNITAEN